MSQVSRRDFLKRAAPVVAGVGLAGVLGIDKAFAQSTSPQSSSQGNRGTSNIISTASYIISSSNGTFYALNGTTGVTDFSGSDAATVIQSAVDTLQSGGLVVIRRGVYQLTDDITVGSGIYLLGEQGAVLRVADGAQSGSNGFNMIQITGDNVTIDNLELDGNVGSNPNLAGTTLDAAPANPNMQSGIVGCSGQNGEIVNCYIHDIWNAGVWLAATNGDVSGWEIGSCKIERTGKSQTDPSSTNPPQSANGVYVFRMLGSTSSSIIHDNIISDPYGPGIYLHFDSGSIVSDNVLTRSLELPSSNPGIIVDDATIRIKLRGNQISGFGPGILVGWGGCEDIIVDSNACYDAPNSGGVGYGILIDSSAPQGPALRNVIIKGNICRGNSLSGISASSSQTIIEGNICYNNSRDTMGADQNLRAGILLQASGIPVTSNVSVIGNRCFDDQVSPTQAYGISVAQMSNQITNVLIANNDLQGNGVAAIGTLDCSASRVTGNLGYNPRGLSPIAVGNSPFTYTNNDGVPEAVYVSGGSVSAISKNGTVLFDSAPATVWLEPDESLTVTHLDPPQMIKDQH